MPVITFLTCLNFVRTTEEKERTKEDQRERPCCGVCIQFTKHTVLHRNECVRVRKIYTVCFELKVKIILKYTKDCSYQVEDLNLPIAIQCQ